MFIYGNQNGYNIYTLSSSHCQGLYFMASLTQVKMHGSTLTLLSTFSTCVAEWVRSRAMWLHCTVSQMLGAGSNPRAGTAHQAVRPSGIGKLAAISTQRMTTIEGWEGKAGGRSKNYSKLFFLRPLMIDWLYCNAPLFTIGVSGAVEIRHSYLYLYLAIYIHNG
jgi:hypothetical protein